MNNIIPIGGIIAFVLFWNSCSQKIQKVEITKIDVWYNMGSNRRLRISTEISPGIVIRLNFRIICSRGENLLNYSIDNCALKNPKVFFFLQASVFVMYFRIDYLMLI